MKLKQELPWFPFYCNDFLADTRNMTAEEIGGYIQLVATYWVNGPIVNKPEVVNKIAGMDASLIVDMFFEVDSNGKLFSPYFAELKEAAILRAYPQIVTISIRPIKSVSLTDYLSAMLDLYGTSQVVDYL